MMDGSSERLVSCGEVEDGGQTFGRVINGEGKVRKIFRLVASGFSVSEVARQVNESGS